MDFEYRYTPEQEAFRREVKEWLAAAVPPTLQRPLDAAHTDRETWLQLRELRRQLGAKGWLYPTWPKEYGGGGLTPDHDMVIKEEFMASDLPMHIESFYHPGDALLAGVLTVWGTEEQKERWMRPLLEGQIRSVQLSTEPSAGSDMASVKTRAVQDGDDWVITGEKVFNAFHQGYMLTPPADIDIQEEFDEMYVLAVTDPDAPRHRNLGWFVVPSTAPGVTFHTLDLLSYGGKQHIYMDEVRIPLGRLVGSPGQGWQVANTGLELEHGGTGQLVPRDMTIEQLFSLARDRGAGKDRHLQQVTIDAYIDSQVHRLLGLRNYWMYQAKEEMTYHGSQSSLWRKESNLRIADAIREVLGLTSLLSQDDPQAPFGGSLEDHQRDSLVGAHPAGTIEIQKVIMARRLGVSRTKERAAVTPSTMQRRQGPS